MPKFFLHQVFPGQRIPDPDGAEFHSLESARIEAVAAAQEIAADALRAGKGLVAIAFEITDDAGSIVAVIPFNDVIAPY